MKLTLTAFILILMQQVCFGQNLSQWDTKIDSLQNQLLNPSSNTAKIKTIFERNYYGRFTSHTARFF